MINLLKKEYFDNLKEFLSHYFEMTEELTYSLRKCLKECERGESDIFDKNLKFGSTVFDEDDYGFKSESVLTWKQFLKLVLHSDAFENVIDFYT